MFLQISARPDARLIAAALRHNLRRPMLLARLAGWVVITVALFVDTPLKLVLAAVGAALAIGIPFALLNSGTRRALSTVGPTTYEITDDGIANSDQHSRHAYAWTSFVRVSKLPGQLVFALDSARFLPVPTASLTQWQIEEVLGAASGHGVQVTRA